MAEVEADPLVHSSVAAGGGQSPLYIVELRRGGFETRPYDGHKDS